MVIVICLIRSKYPKFTALTAVERYPCEVREWCLNNKLEHSFVYNMLAPLCPVSIRFIKSHDDSHIYAASVHGALVFLYSLSVRSLISLVGTFSVRSLILDISTCHTLPLISGDLEYLRNEIVMYIGSSS